MAKPDLQPVNLGSIARGALMELFEIEIAKLAANIADTKTKATKERRLTLEWTAPSGRAIPCSPSKPIWPRTCQRARQSWLNEFHAGVRATVRRRAVVALLNAAAGLV